MRQAGGRPNLALLSPGAVSRHGAGAEGPGWLHGKHPTFLVWEVSDVGSVCRPEEMMWDTGSRASREIPLLAFYGRH